MLPIIIGAVSLIAYGLFDENSKPKAVKKMAKGGNVKSFEKIFEEYEENEDNNYHSENVVLLAKNFGSAEDLKLAKSILKKHESEGSLSEDLNKQRSDLSEKLYPKLIASKNKMAKGGNIVNLKEGDNVWNAIGKKLVVNKVTDTEYHLSSFMQIGDSPFSKKKVNEYIEKGEWTLKPNKMAKGGGVEDFSSVNYPTINQTEENAKKWLNSLIKEKGRKEAESVVRYNLTGKNPFYRFNNSYDNWLSSAINNDKFAKGGNISNEEQERFNELNEKINSYLKGMGQVSSKEMVEHAKLKHKINLAKFPLYKKQIDWEKSNNFGKGGNIKYGSVVYEVVKDSNGYKIINKYDLGDEEKNFNEYIKESHKRKPYIHTDNWRLSMILFNFKRFKKENLFDFIPNEKLEKIYDKYSKGGNINSEIDELYVKSGFINDDFNWKLKLIEMLEDSSIEAYQIYQKLNSKQKEEVLQELFSMNNDMGADGDGEIETSRENLEILLEDAKNGKKYAKGGRVVSMREKKAYNKMVDDYKYFVIVNNKIESGFEYKSDAEDLANDNYPKGKVLSALGVKRLGLDLEDFKNRNKYEITSISKINK